MVYDEGFEMNIGETSFFAFSKYKSQSPSNVKNSDDNLTPGYVS